MAFLWMPRVNTCVRATLQWTLEPLTEEESPAHTWVCADVSSSQGDTQDNTEATGVSDSPKVRPGPPPAVCPQVQG